RGEFGERADLDGRRRGKRRFRRALRTHRRARRNRRPRSFTATVSTARRRRRPGRFGFIVQQVAHQLVGGRKVGGIGEADQRHLAGGDGPRRVAHFKETFEQHLPGTRQRRDRKLRR